MRFSSYFFGVLICMAAIVYGPVPARADQSTPVNAVHCPHFTASQYNLEGKTGNAFGLLLTNDNTSCARATTWAKKMTATSTSTGSHFPQQVSGPSGYKCYITPDGSGHVVGGTCHKYDSSGKITASWDWLATPGSG
jgi:hypothetical protein